MAVSNRRVREAAEGRGIRTDDVLSTTYDFESRRVTLRHYEVRQAPVEGFGQLGHLSFTRESVFTLDADDAPSTCPSCGR